MCSVSQGGGGCARFNPEFVEDVHQVFFYRSEIDAQSGGDLAVSFALRHPGQHFGFTPGETERTQGLHVQRWRFVLQKGRSIPDFDSRCAVDRASHFAPLARCTHPWSSGSGVPGKRVCVCWGGGSGVPANAFAFAGVEDFATQDGRPARIGQYLFRPVSPREKKVGVEELFDRAAG